MFKMCIHFSLYVSHAEQFFKMLTIIKQRFRPSPLRQSQVSKILASGRTQPPCPPALVPTCYYLPTYLDHALDLEPVSNTYSIFTCSEPFFPTYCTDLGSILFLVLGSSTFQGLFYKYLPPGWYIVSLSKLDITTPGAENTLFDPLSFKSN